MTDIVERLRDHILDQDKEIARLRAREEELVAELERWIDASSDGVHKGDVMTECNPLYCTYGNHILSAEVAENARLRAREAELVAALHDVAASFPYDTFPQIRAALAKVEEK